MPSGETEVPVSPFMRRFRKLEWILFPSFLYAVALLIVFSGIWVGKNYVARGWEYVSSDTAQVLATMWDAKRLTSIATQGYMWNGDPHTIQNIAYFPLYAIVEKILGVVFSLWNPLVLIVPAILFGLVSSWFFYLLARRLLDPNLARMALAAYLFYPGNVFFVRAYPVSLMNLLVILTLLALLEGKLWKAALWSGIGSLAGPLMVFLSLTVVIVWSFEQWKSLRSASGTMMSRISGKIPALSAFSLAAFSGFAGFLVYQAVAFHDPLAFIRVQEAWEKSGSLVQRIYNFFFLKNMVAQNHPAHFVQAITHGSLKHMDMHVHYLINLFMLSAFAGLLWIQRKATPWYFTLFALLFLGGYWWFMASVSGIKATVRLIYPVIPAFLGVGVLQEKYPELARVLPIVFAVLSFLESALMMEGYWVI
ncbi:MAG: hypothetical protein D084_Lepto4C00420G0005 [Leptospirillum sp. Group IV 'UBA BS']|nr:MAG: hypothetical protein D084_Lepto4C00420G0005 [Leptospirillum sp. Group IV 'UBA BS']